MAMRDLCQTRQVRDDERGIGDGLHIQRLRSAPRSPPGPHSSFQPLCSPPGSLCSWAKLSRQLHEHAQGPTLVRLVMAAATSSGLVMSTKVVVTPHFVGKNDFSSAKVPPEARRSVAQLLESTHVHT